eukprot:scaffold614348_cov63-Attheya_sp.AAC.4
MDATAPLFEPAANTATSSIKASVSRKTSLSAAASHFAPSSSIHNDYGGQTYAISAARSNLSPDASGFVPIADSNVCRFFVRGACRKGLDCHFVHDVSRTPSSAGGVDANTRTSTDRACFDGGIKCTYGPGLAIEKLELGTEQSSTVVIACLPMGTSEQDIRSHLAPCGELSGLSVKCGNDKTMYTIVSFTEASMAWEAVRMFHGTEANSWKNYPATKRSKKESRQDGKKASRVSVTVKSSDSSSSAACGVSIKVHWYLPVRCAWIHFGNRWEAERTAKAVNDKELGGRSLSAKFQQPSFNQRTNFSVWVGNISERVTEELLIQFVQSKGKCRVRSVSLGDLPFKDCNGPAVVQRLLERQGGGHILSFVQSDSDTVGVKRKALVKFANDKDADRAFEYFKDMQNVTELGGSRLFVQRILTIKFVIPSSTLSIIEKALAVSLAQFTATVRSSTFAGPLRSTISIQADNMQTIALVREQLGPLLGGEVVRDSADASRILWNRSMASNTLAESLRTSLGIEAGLVLFDRHRQEVRVFGPEAQRKKVAKLIIEKSKQSTETHAVPVSSDEYNYVLRSGREVLDKIIRAAGAEKVSLNIGNRSLLVEGDTAQAERARTHITRLFNKQKRGLNVVVEVEEECPVCLCSPDEDDTVRLSCKHVYCRDCFTMWLSGSATSCQFPLSCLEEGCSVLVMLADLHSFLPADVMARLQRAALDHHIRRNHATLQHCPSPACTGIYRVAEGMKLSSCSSCVQIICLSCETSHEGLTCKEYAHSSLPPDHLRLKIIDDILTLRCPRCRQAFLDFEGCFAISCSGCSCKFCGWCLEDCGNDAHPHVKRCPHKPHDADSYFGTREQFNQAQNKRRHTRVLAFLATLGPNEKSNVLESIRQDLKELELQL